MRRPLLSAPFYLLTLLLILHPASSDIRAENDGGKVTRIVVSLGDQAFAAYAGQSKVLVGPISSGRETHPTPPGKYHIIRKHKDWVSTIYDVPMPFFLRFNTHDMGMHAGILPGQPASHGCIRLTRGDAEALFNMTPIGANVVVTLESTPDTEGVDQPPFVPTYYRIVDGKKVILSEAESFRVHTRKQREKITGGAFNPKR